MTCGEHVKKSIDSNSNSNSETLEKIKELNDKVDCLQRSLALHYQILPDKLREAIIDGLNERNKRSFPI